MILEEMIIIGLYLLGAILMADIYRMVSDKTYLRIKVFWLFLCVVFWPIAALLRLISVFIDFLRKEV